MDPCNWVGVTCANISGFTSPRVIAITVSSKNITGYLPSEIGALMYLRRLNLHGNFLSGRIPERLSNASSLHSINLYSNNFSGELPAGLCSLPSLQNLDVSRNSISGKLPPAFGSCNKLQRLVLSNNELTGEVPAEVWPEMENLVELDLSGNRLSGRIPAELGMMKLMTGTLNLSHNAFEGEIPVELGKLPAEVSIDLRGNHLSGEIPSVGALENRAPEFFLGNPGLCGDPLPIRCESSPTGNAIENLDKTRGKGLSTRWIVLISALDAVVVAVIGILLFCFFWKGGENRRTIHCRDKLNDCSGESENRSTICCCSFRTNPESTDTDTDETSLSITISHSNQIETDSNPNPKLEPLDENFPFELDELLRSPAYVLGDSRTVGIVYKVVLGCGTAMAVRKLGTGGTEIGGKNNKEFVAEVETVGNVKHPNVVRLKAYYCSREDKLLVTDFVPNGNLASALKGRKDLNWNARVGIAKGMAKGITYIHECNPRRFVHGNIKPTNILLDNNYNPQISDFGLLRLQCIVEGSSLSGGVKRSDDWTNNNYRAPEARILVTRPSQKWDIYSFGVILLEMLTGRSAEFPGSSPSSVKSTSSTSMKSTSFSSSSSPPGELISLGMH
ncbi:Receptor protein kinase-like protein [Zostera marina]|uniref:Receptor protein kinase-like protein n=1 Tax=Zostera marina TaxID=29655 RepID=A0A0K9PAN4_ZOSMR|nr:Receptor protein kinase-like protein [Zostera marina]